MAPAPPTRDVVEKWAKQAPFAVKHAWHEDQGFRKTRILNAAVALAEGDYVVFLDGDCLPARRFVADHLALAEKGTFVQGRRAFVAEKKVADLLAGRATLAQLMLTGQVHGLLRPFVGPPRSFDATRRNAASSAATSPSGVTTSSPSTASTKPTRAGASARTATSAPVSITLAASANSSMAAPSSFTSTIPNSIKTTCPPACASSRKPRRPAGFWPGAASTSIGRPAEWPRSKKHFTLREDDATPTLARYLLRFTFGDIFERIPP